MSPFTAEEARAILKHTPLHLCARCASNPNREAVGVLLDEIEADVTFRHDPAWAAVYGVALGRAIGIREERQRRKNHSSDIRQRIVDILEKVISEDNLRRIYRFVQYIYIYREG